MTFPHRLRLLFPALFAALVPAAGAQVATPASPPASAAAPVPPARPAQPAQPVDLFDFWLGDWDVRWTNANGSPGHGRNHVARTLDGRVIQEDFEQDAADPPPRLVGRSLSVLQAGSGLWRQSWADNQGGYFALTGSVDGANRLFTTAPVTAADGSVTLQRMVFRDIRPDAFTWDWEGSRDGGRSWQLLWQLHYRRR